MEAVDGHFARLGDEAVALARRDGDPPETLVREVMVAPAHHMVNLHHSIDRPVRIDPPAASRTEGAGV